jgi:hypothetical protein
MGYFALTRLVAMACRSAFVRVAHVARLRKSVRIGFRTAMCVVYPWHQVICVRYFARWARTAHPCPARRTRRAGQASGPARCLGQSAFAEGPPQAGRISLTIWSDRDRGPPRPARRVAPCRIKPAPAALRQKSQRSDVKCLTITPCRTCRTCRIFRGLHHSNIFPGRRPTRAPARPA